METNTLILKYNDEEFKETGKWNGMDQLSEIYASTSPAMFQICWHAISMEIIKGNLH
ncbi:hypothetical protein [Chryseobacterium sp. RU33C]|uniref:hypothetical protein n=1 Tax=Chryseobacterium sp. RU33C TaxID=1907398 RepID=UPI0014802B22|nr:hypothetical protein [Chryseobacterium sp. RU33C]